MNIIGSLPFSKTVSNPEDVEAAEREILETTRFAHSGKRLLQMKHSDEWNIPAQEKKNHQE
jgi:hypothetical protein